MKIQIREKFKIKKWSKEEVNKLKKMYEAGYSDLYISKELKRTKNSINIKRNREGLSYIKEHRFSDEGLSNIIKSRKKRSGKNHPTWNGGKRINHNGYREILMPNHHRARGNGYVFEHILIAEKKIGRVIKNNEVVHHINENKLDNRMGNLQVILRSKHSTHHGFLKRKGFSINCIVCGSSFYRKPCQRENGMCCSLKCVGLFTKMKKDGVFYE